MAKNQAFFDLLKGFAETKSASSAQIALAWLIAQNPYVMPIPVTTKLHHLEKNLGVTDTELSAIKCDNLTNAAAGTEDEGDRYAPTKKMAMAGRKAPARPLSGPVGQKLLDR